MTNQMLDVTFASELTNLLHRTYQADTTIGIHFAAATISKTDVIKHLQSTPTFGLIENGQLLSTVSVRLPWSQNPGPYQLPHLGWIATLPEVLHTGHAKSLLGWVEQHFLQEDLKVPAATLGTAYEHPWLKKAYIKLGYQPIAILRKFPDHRTVYFLKQFDTLRCSQLNDPELKQVLQTGKEVAHEI